MKILRVDEIGMDSIGDEYNRMQSCECKESIRETVNIARWMRLLSRESMLEYKKWEPNKN